MRVFIASLSLITLFLLGCQKDLSQKSSSEIPDEVLFSPDSGKSFSLRRVSTKRGSRGIGDFTPPPAGDSSTPAPTTTPSSGDFSTPPMELNLLNDMVNYTPPPSGVSLPWGYVYDSTLPDYMPLTDRTTGQLPLWYLPSFGHYSLNGTYSPFGKSKKKFFLPPLYGYSYSIDSFLGFADRYRHKKPRTQTVVRMQFGPGNLIVPMNTNALTLVAEHCWEVEIISNRNLTIARQYQVPNFTVNQPNANTIHLIGTRSSVTTELSGLAFSLDSKKRCDTVTDYYAGLSDPWTQGYQGIFNNLFYFFPPPQQTYCHEAASLRVRGTVQYCGNTNQPTIQALDTFDQDLSQLVNTRGGTPFKEIPLPVIQQSIKFRAINFNKSDWLY